MLVSTSFWLLATSTLSTAYIIGRQPITDCLAASAIPQVLPGSSNYTSISAPFNIRLPFTPAAVAVPKAAYHVQQAVRCAVNHGYTVSARSGGHSYASWGIGGENGHLVIDLKRFNEVILDKSTNIATVGAGSRLGNVALALYQQGKRAISHGTCPEVGVGGLTLHGGYGYSSRRQGLTLDNLLEAEVVLADGSLVRASKTQNPDLFWALRGAGSSYGIITRFHFQTFAAPEQNTVFEYNLQLNNSAEAQKSLLAIQNFAATVQPAELQSRLFINRDVSVFIGMYYGPLADFQRVIKPLADEIGSPNLTLAETRGWIDGLLSYSNGPLEQPLDFYDKHENFYAKSLMAPALSTDAFAALADYWFGVAKTNLRNWFLIIDLHGGPSSAVSKVAVDATAYPHRNALLKMQFFDRVSNDIVYPSNGFGFLNGWVKAIEGKMPGTTFGMYANYADPSLSKEEAHKRYWQGNYERLRNIKKMYDPKGRFTNPQGVESA